MIKPDSIDSIRDLAKRLEKSDMLASYNLMKLTLGKKQNIENIKRNYPQYKRFVEIDNFKKDLSLMNKRGDVAIIPIGFRCYTKELISQRLGISQPSMPFDNGFFPPSSVESILRNPKVKLDFNINSTFQICKK